MFRIKLIKDDRCKKHLCQDKNHPAIYRCGTNLFNILQRNPLLSEDLIKKHPNFSWIENFEEKLGGTK
jgi:hypothetical protein